MRNLQSPEVYRSMGFWNEATQQGILDTKVAIGGVGGAGYLIGIELAHMGVQNFSIADPEPFDDVNSNRVLGAREDTYGRNKAEVFKEEILKVNGDAVVHAFPEGIDENNVEDFAGDSDIIFDALELSMPHLGTMVARQARKTLVPVVNVEYVGHGAQGTSFDPRSEWTFERVMGIEGGEEALLEEVAKQRIATDRFLAFLPPYIDLKTLMAVESGSPLPSNMIGAGLAASIACAEALKHVRQRIGEPGLPPVFAPQMRWMDAYTGDSGITENPVASFHEHLAVVADNNEQNIHEEASYTTEERARRGDTGSMEA